MSYDVIIAMKFEGCSGGEVTFFAKSFVYIHKRGYIETHEGREARERRGGERERG